MQGKATFFALLFLVMSLILFISFREWFLYLTQNRTNHTTCKGMKKYASKWNPFLVFLSLFSRSLVPFARCVCVYLLPPRFGDPWVSQCNDVAQEWRWRLFPLPRSSFLLRSQLRSHCDPPPLPQAPQLSQIGSRWWTLGQERADSGCNLFTSIVHPKRIIAQTLYLDKKWVTKLSKFYHITGVKSFLRLWILTSLLGIPWSKVDSTKDSI